MYEKKNYINLNMDALSGIINEYFYAESDYRTFCKRIDKIRYTSEYFEKRGQIAFESREKYDKSYQAYMTLVNVCDLLNLDRDTVVSVFKSIRRNSQYQHGWNKEAHFSSDRYFYFEDVKAGSVESFCRLCRSNY